MNPLHRLNNEHCRSKLTPIKYIFYFYDFCIVTPFFHPKSVFCLTSIPDNFCRYFTKSDKTLGYT